jgi:hypothetical protein
MTSSALTDSQTRHIERPREAPLTTPTDLPAAATRDIGGGLNDVLAERRTWFLFESSRGGDTSGH